MHQRWDSCIIKVNSFNIRGVHLIDQVVLLKYASLETKPMGILHQRFRTIDSANIKQKIVEIEFGSSSVDPQRHPPHCR